MSINGEATGGSSGTKLLKKVSSSNDDSEDDYTTTSSTTSSKKTSKTITRRDQFDGIVGRFQQSNQVFLDKLLSQLLPTLTNQATRLEATVNTTPPSSTTTSSTSSTRVKPILSQAVFLEDWKTVPALNKSYYELLNNSKKLITQHLNADYAVQKINMSLTDGKPQIM